MNQKTIYLGAYLEVVDNQEFAFDVYEINESLSKHDQCSIQKENKIFWLPNTSSEGIVIFDHPKSEQVEIEITPEQIERSIRNFSLAFSDAIDKLKDFYGGGTVKFGYVTGWK